jgi:hypothetical protein
VVVFFRQKIGCAKGNYLNFYYSIKINFLYFSCGNINWARRSTCNMCNMPKFQKAEARTGIHFFEKKNKIK